jgi:hypothetical protein
MLLDNRELVERLRRRKLHAKIGALESKLSRMPKPATTSDREKYLKLWNKIRKLKARAGQLELPLVG